MTGCADRGSAEQAIKVTAIDILLDPDTTMLERATAANERLRNEYPDGFSLDEAHRPHITCVQRFVRTADLKKVYAAVSKVLAEETPKAWRLEAHKYYYIPAGETGLAGIVVKPSEDLVRFQAKLIDAIAPFTVETSDKAAFFTTPEEPGIEPGLIDYVRDFVPKASGDHFNPHVTIGLAKRDYLDAMLAEPFDAFTFAPVGVSVYQLGNFGAARKRLKTWDLAP
jgi:hypothetical protein